MSRYGLAIDNLRAAELVLAGGEVTTASEEADPDLFWAIRGGGGNFGVVTSFELRAHAVPNVLSGPVLHTLDAAPEVLSFYRENEGLLYMAYVSAAVYDAATSIQGGYEPYGPASSRRAGPRRTPR